MTSRESRITTLQGMPAVASLSGEDALALEEILGFLAERRGVDFRDYRPDTLARGTQSRLAALGIPNLVEYLRRLASDPSEVDRLLQSLVVPFTSFFRNAGVFEALRTVVLPYLYGRASSTLPVRGWCIGVATGEEAWSLAMLLADGVAPGMSFEVIASDIDARSLALGRAGRYSQEALATLPPSLRARYLESDEQGLRIAESLRTRVRFAQHDLMGRTLAPREAVVASFALVLLRNVLIYFDRRLQQKALERLTAVIEPGGVLVLGDAELLPDAHVNDFSPFPGIDVRLRIYRRREAG